jgi:hypothetical protein
MTGHRQPWYLDRLRAELERVAAIEDRRERGPALGRLRPALGRLRPSSQALVALAVVAALVAVVVTVAPESEVERPAAPPGKKVVATDVEGGVRFSLDGRVLTVQLIAPVRDQTFETVSGAEISATCGANVAASSGDPQRETTLTRRWLAGQTSLSFRFPRDVSRWCLLRQYPSGSIVASVGFPAASPEARGPIAETANKWARHFASNAGTCTDYMSRTGCKLVTECERVGRTQIPACRAKARQWAAAFLGATVQAIAIRGDRAAATLSNDVIVQLRRTTTGEWQIDGMGPFGAVGPDAAAQRREHRGP